MQGSAGKGDTAPNQQPDPNQKAETQAITPIAEEATSAEAGTGSGLMAGEAPGNSADSHRAEHPESKPTEDRQGKGTLNPPDRQASQNEPQPNTGGKHSGRRSEQDRRRAIADEPAPARLPVENSSEAQETPAPTQVALPDNTPVFDLAPEASESTLVDNILADQNPAHPHAAGPSGAEHGRADTRPVHMPRLMPNVAWMRNAMLQEARSFASEDGWNVLEMKLDEEGGTMTLKAKREEGQMSVAVGFSDPMLRTLAQANLPQLKEALQAQYEAPVEFSLSSEGSDGGKGESDGGSHPGQQSREAAQPGTTRTQISAIRSLVTGALHEWIG